MPGKLSKKVGKILSFSKESTHKTSLDKIEKIKELLEIYVQRQDKSYLMAKPCVLVAEPMA